MPPFCLFVDPLIQIALAVCCSIPNLELLDAVFDRNLPQIVLYPQLLRHALLECCSHADIDTFTHILNKCEPPLKQRVYPAALEFWCEVGDLEAVTLILESDMDRGLLARTLPKLLFRANYRADTELTELLTRFAGDLIKGPHGIWAFSGAWDYDKPKRQRYEVEYAGKIRGTYWLFKSVH